METSIDKCKTDMEAQLSSVNNEVKRMKTAFVERFDQMKDVLVKMEDRMKENTRKIHQVMIRKQYLLLERQELVP